MLAHQVALHLGDEGAGQHARAVTTSATSQRLGNGRTLKIIAKNLSKENLYVKSIRLNGKKISGIKIRHEDVIAGGELVFEMTDRK